MAKCIRGELNNYACNILLRYYSDRKREAKKYVCVGAWVASYLENPPQAHSSFMCVSVAERHARVLLTRVLLVTSSQRCF